MDQCEACKPCSCESGEMGSTCCKPEAECTCPPGQEEAGGTPEIE